MSLEMMGACESERRSLWWGRVQVAFVVLRRSPLHLPIPEATKYIASRYGHTHESLHTTSVTLNTCRMHDTLFLQSHLLLNPPVMFSNCYTPHNILAKCITSITFNVLHKEPGIQYLSPSIPTEVHRRNTRHLSQTTHAK